MQTFDPLDATRHPPGRVFRNLQWLYLAGVCVMLAAVRTGGDRWGWATVLAYGPRDAAVVPGVILILIGLFRRRVAWVAVVAVVIALGPLIDFNVPIAKLMRRVPADQVIRVMQLNADGHGTDGRKYDLPRVLALLRDTGRDVATIDEWPTDQPPPLPAPGWSCFRDDEQLVLSRWPVIDSHVFPRSIFGRNWLCDRRPAATAGRAVAMAVQRAPRNSAPRLSSRCCSGSRARTPRCSGACSIATSNPKRSNNGSPTPAVAAPT